MRQPDDFCLTSSPSVLIVGEYLSSNDKKAGVYLSGTTGKHLIDTLQRTNFKLSDCFYAPLLEESPPRGLMDNLFLTKTEAKRRGISEINGSYPEPVLEHARHKIQKLLTRLKPTLIISLGNIPMWAVGGISGSAVTWNGSMHTWKNCNFMPIISPITVQRMWTLNVYFEHAFRKAQPWTQTLWKEPSYRFRISNDYYQTFKTLEDLWVKIALEPTLISCDIETRNRHIACLGLGWSELDAVCIPFMTVKEPCAYWTSKQEAELVILIKHILTHPNALVTGQNYEYDRQYIARYWGFKSNLAYDTMTLHHTWSPDLRKGLSVLAFLYLPWYRYWKEESKDWDPHLGEKQLWNYNCIDCVNTWDIANRLRTRPIATDPFYLHQHAMHDPVLQMTLRGVKCDIKVRDQMIEETVSKLEERATWFESLAGFNIRSKSKIPWWQSTKQTQALFYDVMNIRPVYKKKGVKQTQTADDEALKTISKREPFARLICQKLQEFRSLRVFHDTFLTMELDWDNRIRCQYHIDGPKTFRFASTEDAFHYGTNLQNIPGGTK